MNYEGISNLLIRLKSAYESVGAETELTIEKPVAEDKVIKAEKELGMKLPLQIRNFLLEFSGKLDFSAWLPEEFELPEELEEIFSAAILISLEEIVNAEGARKEWQESCFSDEEDEYDAIWHNKLGIMTVPNGDVIAFDIGKDEVNPPVVYLSHDDGEGHGYILGKDFETYLENLLRIGACGNEDWQILPFCEDEEAGINPDCENAREYRKIIGL